MPKALSIQHEATHIARQLWKVRTDMDVASTVSAINSMKLKMYARGALFGLAVGGVAVVAAVAITADITLND